MFATGFYLLYISPTSVLLVRAPRCVAIEFMNLNRLQMWIELLFVSVSVIVSTVCLIQQHRGRRLNIINHHEPTVNREVPDIEDVPPDPEDGGGTDDEDGAEEGTGMKLLRSAERRRTEDSRLCRDKCSDRQRQLYVQCIHV